MDAYLSKPIRITDMKALIAKLVSMASAVENGAMTKRMETNGVDKPPALDQEALLDQFGYDWGFIGEISALFLSESPDYLAAIRTALEAGQASALQEAAHTLKGVVANLHAEPSYEAALRLEEMGRSGLLSEARAALVVLEAEVKRLEAALVDLREQAAAH